MTVAKAPLPRRGDAEATNLPSPDAARRPPFPRCPLPESRVCGGSRFWALAGESFDDEEALDCRTAATAATAECVSPPRSGPSPVTFGEVFASVWQTVGVSRHRGSGRRRRAFASARKRSCFLPRSGSPEPRSSCALSGPGGERTPVIQTRAPLPSIGNLAAPIPLPAAPIPLPPHRSPPRTMTLLGLGLFLGLPLQTWLALRGPVHATKTTCRFPYP
jgi:hypothetical protein